MKPEEEDIDEDILLRERKKEKTKDEILDDAFRKAELSKKFPSKTGKMEKKIEKKPFAKSGIILIVIAIIALTIINYLPWMYIKYNADYGEVQQIFYKDFKNEELEYEQINTEILSLFNSPCANCSNNSKYYIGLTIDDFTSVPQTASNGFITLLLIGLLFTVFVVLDRFYDFSERINSLIHSAFAAGIIIISTIILLSTIKFIGAYFLLYYNWSFMKIIGINDARLVFIVPIMIVFISFALVKGGTTIMKINFREIEKKRYFEKYERPSPTYRYRSIDDE